MSKSVWVLAIVGGVIGLAAMGGGTPKSKAFATSAGSAIILPPDQTNFVKIVEQMRSQYDAAPNAMQKSDARRSRKDQVCNVVPTSVGNWVGTIKQIGTNGDGKGYVIIEIANSVTVGSWNNALSDFQDHTLMDPQSYAYKKISGMAEGQTVQFSGSFSRGNNDCFVEKSVTEAGSMDSPDWVMRIDNVERM